MSRTLALIRTDFQSGFFGHPARLTDRLGGWSVLELTLRRVAQVPQVEKLVLVHPADQDPVAGLAAAGLSVESLQRTLNRPVVFHADPGGLRDDLTPMRTAARKWTLGAWRGGIGGGVIYDELLPAAPLAAALAAHGGQSALLLGADWCLFDPHLAQLQLARHLGAGDGMSLIFTQAPPGLGALVCSGDLLGRLAAQRAAFGPMFAYHPQRPALDPIGREVCVPIEAEVRDLYRRFVFDTPRAQADVRAVAAVLGEGLLTADANAMARAFRLAEAAGTGSARAGGLLPAHVRVELTPERLAAGLATAQHHGTLDRPAMPLALAESLCRQLGDPAAGGDVAVLFGGLGDALLYPHWQQVVATARASGVLGIGLQTDLQVQDTVIDALLHTPVDVLSVRLNADTPAVYHQVMGEHVHFEHAMARILQFFEGRNRFARPAAEAEAGDPRRGLPGLPWLVPTMVKMRENLVDLESFFDRWTLLAGHAVLERFSTGLGRVPDHSPVPMTPVSGREPGPYPVQLTVLSDGRVTLSPDDWQGEQAIGNVHDQPLLKIWQRAFEPAYAP